MKKTLLCILIACRLYPASSQRIQHEISIAVSSNNSTLPFSKFITLFSDVIHPGIGITDQFVWKKNHNWFQRVTLGYFSHRFVQRALLVYTETGYRVNITERLNAQAAVGAGYLHSIPATEVFRLEKSGRYKNAKGIGRPQAMADLSIGLNYKIAETTSGSIRIFLQYQERFQFPFVKSYVPVLPYSSVSTGATAPLNFLITKK